MFCHTYGSGDMRHSYKFDKPESYSYGVEVSERCDAQASTLPLVRNPAGRKL